MLSFGIRFGQGFDKSTILKTMQFIPTDFDYDLLVIGTNPGGVACVREAKVAGKKVAIIRMKKYSLAEAEGFDEDLKEMAEALEIESNQFLSNSKENMSATQSQIGVKTSPIGKHVSGNITTLNPNAKKKSSGSLRKVRLSRLDLNNELFKRGQQCRKLMHNAALLGDLAETAYKSGWRVVTVTSPLTINWKKMTEQIMDYVMKENWALQTALKEEMVEIIEGSPIFVDDHTVEVLLTSGHTNRYTAAAICLAISSECVLPEDVPGAKEYGITYDDFIRMDKEPGKTLVVGSTPEGLECAGIMADCKLPVTVVSRSNILKGHDSEMSQLIVNDLKSKGVKFMQETNLVSITNAPQNKITANFITQSSDNSSIKSELVINEQYDTVLFAVSRKVNLGEIRIDKVNVEIEPFSQKIIVDKTATTAVPHIYAVGDVVAGFYENFESCELDGKLLGKRLFHNGTELMDYFVIPSVIYTPTEYAFVGISEDAASFRLGEQCIDVYYKTFKPLDYVIPHRKGHCFAKIIVFKRNDRIIGIHIFGSEAGEMIQGFAAALKTGLTMTDFQTLVGATGTKVQEILKLKEMRTNEGEDDLLA